MPISISVENFDFILEDEKNDENPTVFKCKTLTGVEISKCISETSIDLVLAFSTGVVGWEAFYDANGLEIKPKRIGGRVGTLSPTSLAHFSYQTIAEVAAEIIKRSMPESDELGK